MTILDQETITEDQVRATAEAIAGITGEDVIDDTAGEVEAMAEVDVETPVEVVADLPADPIERLRKILAGAIPNQIDHSACDHEASDAERRRCRKAKIAAALASGEGMTVEARGETYVSGTVLRAMLLDMYKSRFIGEQNDLNTFLRRLQMDDTTYNRRNDNGYSALIDVTMEFTTNAGQMVNGTTLRGLRRRFRDYYSTGADDSLKVHPVNEDVVTTTTRTFVTYEGEAEVSREKKTQTVFTVRVTGQYSFGERFTRMTVEARTQHVLNWLQAWINNWVRLDNGVVVKHNLDNTEDSIDAKLAVEYRNIIGN